MYCVYGAVSWSAVMCDVLATRIARSCTRQATTWTLVHSHWSCRLVYYRAFITRGRLVIVSLPAKGRRVVRVRRQTYSAPMSVLVGLDQENHAKNKVIIITVRSRRTEVYYNYTKCLISVFAYAVYGVSETGTLHPMEDTWDLKSTSIDNYRHYWYKFIPK